MSQPYGDPTAGEESPTQQGLRRDSMSVGSIVFCVVAAAAPLTVVGSLFSVIIGIGNGAGIAGAFLLVAVVLLVFAVGYVAMSGTSSTQATSTPSSQSGWGAPSGWGPLGSRSSPTPPSSWA